MQRSECKPGTEVIIRGTVKRDDGTDYDPIEVNVRRDNGEMGGPDFFDPSQLEPAQPKYDLARKYRNGDLVRITGFHGRLFGMGNERELAGKKILGVVTICSDEELGGDVGLPDGILLHGFNYLSVACIELVKPVEEIEAERPYKVEDVGSCFQVRKGGNYIYEVFWESNTCPKSPYSKGEAREKAKELCDELNRKHRESLNA